jgi:precorrin-6B methylase 2
MAEDMVSEAIPLSNDVLTGLFSRYMDAIYEDLSGYITYEDGEKDNAAKENIFLTYGEIKVESVNKILQVLSLKQEDVFYDFGSGVGKVALQAFMQQSIKKAHGIEASEKRHQSAQTALASVKKDLPEMFVSGRTLDYTCGNFLTADVSDATVIFICATCFSEDLMLAIGERLNKHAPTLRFIASLKPIPNSKLPLIGKMDILCTWDKSACYVYGEGDINDFNDLYKDKPKTDLGSDKPIPTPGASDLLGGLLKG